MTATTRRRSAARALAPLLLLGGTACGGWPAWLHGRSPAEAAPPREPLLRSVRQLTFEGRRAGEGYFSADGARMIFQSEREPGNPFYQMYLMDLASGDVRRVSPGTGKTTCGWIHPDGGRVLFASTHEDPGARDEQERELERRAEGRTRRYAWDFDAHYDLFELALESGALRALAPARGYDAEGSWSPDGRLVAFASNRHAYAEPLSPEARAAFERDPSSAMDLYLLETASGQLRRLTETPGYDGGPFFSADGRELVWRRFAPGGRTAEILSMPAGGGAERQLTRLGALSWGPYFHPSGDYVIFATSLHGHENFELYLVDADGRREPVRVTESEGFDGLPAFSPDGHRLAWSSSRSAGGRPQIFLADWDDAGARARLGLSRRRPAAPATVRPDAPEPAARAIRAADLRRHVEALADESMEGRLTGSEGERRATAYVASVFAALGLEPAGDGGDWFQEFEFTAGVSAGPDNQLALQPEGDGAGREFEPGVDWQPLSFSRVGEVPASEVVFAGYGIVAPGSDHGPAYDAYGDLDVRERWVLVFRYLPERVPPEIRQHLSRFGSLRFKAMVARDRGARGILVVSGPSSQVKSELVPFRADASFASTSLAAVSLSDAAAEELLRGSDRELAALQAALDPGDALPGFVLPDVRLAARIDLVQERRTGRNVLARIPAAAASGAPPIAIGAHVDHLGRGVHGTTLAREEERGKVHPGADDNASGVAALLEIAERLAGRRGEGGAPLVRDVLLAAFSGEELGVLGSTHFASALAGNDEGPLSTRIAAYLNMDMIGRLGQSVTAHGMSSSPAWPAEIERAGAAVGLSLVPIEDSYLPTDTTPFYLRDVPVLSFFTGAHAEYHTPRDAPDTLDYAGMQKIARLVARLARSLATRAEPLPFTAAARPESRPERAHLRAYLGTIPDYSRSDAAGVVLAGVARQGPAERAGLRPGDLVVEVAGRRVENIYDYTYALEALRIGETVTIGVVRDGGRLAIEVTPESRE